MAGIASKARGEIGTLKRGWADPQTPAVNPRRHARRRWVSADEAGVSPTYICPWRSCAARLFRRLSGDDVGRDFQDRLAHFAREDQARVAGDVVQHRVELELAAGVGPQDASLAQLLDEA